MSPNALANVNKANFIKNIAIGLWYVSTVVLYKNLWACVVTLQICGQYQ